MRLSTATAMLSLVAIFAFAAGPGDLAAQDAPAANDAPAAADPAPADPAAADPAAATAPAASGAAYVGTWSADASQCAVPQDQQNAPMVVTEAGFDQHEVHCTFKSVTPDGDAWKMSAECAVEGDAQAHDFSFAVAGNALSITDEDGTNQMTRCP